MSTGNEPIVASSASDGRHKIAFVPRGTGTAPNPLSAAVLKATSTIAMTYGFTPDGFNPSGSQATVEDKRYTLPSILSRPGKVTDTLSVKYVDSTDASSPAVVLKPGVEGWFVVRKGKDANADWAAADIVTVHTVICGIQLEDAPTENGLDTLSQGMYITQPTQRKVAVVA